jgi:glycosyltransferase involved in cell wall biosynthesis
VSESLTQLTTNPETHVRLAIHDMGSVHWVAGRTYLRNLIGALQTSLLPQVRVCLLSPSGTDTSAYDGLVPPASIVPYHYRKPVRGTLPWVVKRLNIMRGMATADIALVEALRANQIDVLFSGSLTRALDTATIAWLPDFQHVHFPELFSEVERRTRDQTFHSIINHATRIVLMSEAVKGDFATFAPAFLDKVRVVRPVSWIPVEVYEENVQSVLRLYSLPDRFIYLPNQFWRHKNHSRVLEAIKILYDRGVKVTVVCTGYPVDYRHPTHFADLWQLGSRLGVRDRFIYLGLVPHGHVLSLMRQSLCVLNPSMFEGWGISVDEARSIGKAVLLSDIPAHREQNPWRAEFFDPRECGDLADKMEEIWSTAAPGPDEELEAKARLDLPIRTARYAESFFAVVRDALGQGYDWRDDRPAILEE